MKYSESDLILNPNGSIYHLDLTPEQVATTIITVGDPNRVGEVSKHFEKIEHRSSHREFVAHTGILRGGRRVTVVSTGIGTDNIDIVLTELDALVNIDFQTREPKAEHTTLDIVRIGTSGSLQAEVPMNSIVMTSKAFGFDNLMHFYEAELTGDEFVLGDALADYLEQKSEDLMVVPYVFSADKTLLAQFGGVASTTGYTATMPGFYAPQGRLLRGRSAEPKLLKLLNAFRHKNQPIVNFEMETAGIYGMARLLGHRAVSLSAILANRMDGTFSDNPKKVVEDLIAQVVAILEK